jgi:hypothetical protein
MCDKNMPMPQYILCVYVYLCIQWGSGGGGGGTIHISLCKYFLKITKKIAYKL